MAVIDTSMDMPKSCYECPYCNGENATCDKGVLIPWRAFDVENYRNANCPLKSTDEMIVELEKLKDEPHCCQHYERGIRNSLEVVHKYCDKEQNND